MNNLTYLRLIAIAAVFYFSSSSALSAELNINGFMSFAIGKTFAQGTDTSNNDLQTTFMADAPSGGSYDDNWGFRADSVFGLQFTAELDEKLSVIAQIKGAGGKEFNAEMAWAYLNYKLDNQWRISIGRQRMPLFYYSDFLDVGYAYHWIRIPTETQIALDTFEGIQLTWNRSYSNWDHMGQFYTGNAQANEERFGGEIGDENILGFVYSLSNEQLQLRATYGLYDTWFDSLNSSNTSALAALAPLAKNSNYANKAIAGHGKDSNMKLTYFGLAAHMTFDDTFVVAEYINYAFSEPIVGLGLDTTTGAYISLGHNVGSVIPHITFSSYKAEFEDIGFSPDNFLTETAEKYNTITFGIRWDYHDSAAFKLEYLKRSDKSNTDFVDIYGNRNDVDLLSASIDVVF